MEKFAVVDVVDTDDLDDDEVNSFEAAEDGVPRSFEVSGSTKKLRVKFNKNTGLYAVAFEGGGELPQQLKCAFTSIGKAEKAIDDYNRKKAARSK